MTIGPFSHVRKGAHIGSGVELGNYAEVKNSRHRRRAPRATTSATSGDAEVGERVNIGAGTITANYDGVSASTARTSATGPSSARTRSCAPRSPSARTPSPARARVVTRDVPDGMMALGVPARSSSAAAPHRSDTRGSDPHRSDTARATPDPAEVEPAGPHEDADDR